MRRSVTLAVFSVATLCVSSAAALEWVQTGSLEADRFQHTATLLKDGRVLIVAGNVLTAELYDPGTKTWSPAGSINPEIGPFRSAHTATLLDNGDVLVAGGNIGVGGAISTWRYEIATESWKQVGDLAHPRRFHSATKLGSGDVLLCGGEAENNVQSWSCERFNPATNLWAEVLPMKHVRTQFQMVWLPGEGKPLAIGGRDEMNKDQASTESFDEQSGWSEAPPLKSPRSRFSVTTLPDASVAIVGGSDGSVIGERYSGGSWNFLPPMKEGRLLPMLVSMVNGCLLVIGGNGDPILSPATTEFYDLKKNSWMNGPALPAPAEEATATVLGNGDVLVAGGTDTNAAWLLALAPLGTTCAQNCECASGSCVDGICCATPCDGPCEQCAADGTCTLAAAGTDPDGDCGDDGAASCGQNGSCDGKGGCELYEAGTECGQNGCDGSTLLSATCNGSGECISNSVACAPFLCSTSASSCFSACKSIDDCAAPNVCDAQGKCIPPPEQPPVEFSDCSCRITNASAADHSHWLLALGALSATVVRRRRRSR